MLTGEPTMIIDAHHHLRKEKGYLEQLVSESRRLGIDRVCLLGAHMRALGKGAASNEEVIKVVEQYPDLFIGFATFNLGVDSPNRINEYAHAGFSGIKFINPMKNYDDKDFYPVYGRMEAHGIPGLFHLGIVARSDDDRHYDVNNNRHRPIYLDTIARAFPGLRIIGAHLGNPWYEEATMSARWNPNLYFDLSGSTLKKKSAAFLGELLWWTPTTKYRSPDRKYAWEKIVFGTDVNPSDMEDVLNDYKKVMSELKLPKEMQDKVLGGTMCEILNLK